ncbi:DUF262 domain-containing protein [Pseudomonas capsici]|uniref:DUF262 domain-containing protein n=1 Tax=Pseudomonas capsici TaxID=2810614 RepID=UPI0019CFF6D1|nr:DUF262 domain-containing protein [Pseudomonas capsici]MBN6717224.1 DUF262 domain-containing protein [Pseudomonas capsici]MBN6722125.1 DUF262 domain-containing protein [Pseudomonas capsici]MBN6727186.1 DUF262 domain-containing protein [Pseudomonas capsici]
MSFIETFSLKNTTIMFLYSEKDQIQLDPHYQRMGGVWTLEKKQLLIDSILNDYDVPKLYFHEFSREQKSATGYGYAVVDGRQRLQTIWDFIDGDFSISEDFEYQRDPSIHLANLTYEDVAKEFPKIRIAFDSFVLPVVGLSTDDEDLIEDMFSRLNEAAPLNAAEKRNAIGGDLVAAIRELATSDIFVRRVRFNNNRYKHREVAVRMLLVEESLRDGGRLIDTKKVYLDAFARQYHSAHTLHVNELKKAAMSVVNAMSQVFMEKDELLQAQGNMVVYYLVFRAAIKMGEVDKITRRKLLDFREKIKENRVKAAVDYAGSSYELLEYDRLSQQGTNDSSNIKERFGILARELGLSNIEI